STGLLVKYYAWPLRHELVAGAEDGGEDAGTVGARLDPGNGVACHRGTGHRASRGGCRLRGGFLRRSQQRRGGDRTADGPRHPSARGRHLGRPYLSANLLRFFAARTAKKWPLRGSLKYAGVLLAYP